MADINVKRKRNSPNWPWILLILLAVGIVGWLLIDTGGNNGDLAYIQESEETTDGYVTPGDNVDNNNDQMGMGETEFGQANNNNEAGQGSNGQINSYVSYVKENNANIGKEHNYSSRALKELADALSTLSEEANLQSDPDLQNLRDQADELERNTASDQHSNIMSNAFTSAANVIEKVQNESYPDLEQEADQVKEAAQSLEPTELATNQEEKIKSFFDESADALQAMSR